MNEPSRDPAQVRVVIRDDLDVVVARCRVREIGREVRLADIAIEALATAVSEIARNIVVHAGSGELIVGVARADARCGIVIVARDDGPGIADVERAMQDGYTTANGLGLGLASARRLVDEFELISSSTPAALTCTGTTVTMRKWRS